MLTGRIGIKMKRITTIPPLLAFPGKAGSGGIFRDAIGNWICGYSRSIGIASSVTAELWGLRDGLLLAATKGFSNIMVEMDSQVAIRYVNEGINSTHTHSTIVLECRKLMLQLGVDKVHHIYREANSCADALAKRGANDCSVNTSSHFVVFEEVPDDLKLTFATDFMGTTFT